MSDALTKQPVPVLPNGGRQRRGLMLVLSAPSGTGKTTIARRILAADPNIILSISVTTRPRRPAEVDGRDYFFVDPPRFEAMVAEDGMLEHATVFGNMYGTPRDFVQSKLTAGRDVLFDIDWQGTRQLRQRAPTDLVSVFILPPSYAELERRLRTRGQDSDTVVASRMAEASAETGHWGEYEYIVINDDIDVSVEKVRGILLAERLRRDRQVGMPAFVQALRGQS